MARVLFVLALAFPVAVAAFDTFTLALSRLP